ncbi:MAG: phosphopantothenoylcysteine decarboxylase, partial [Geminicoccaceae bacterium]
LDDRAIKVGFAAETECLLDNAKSKLVRKGLSMICANDVSRSDAGFEVDTNQVSLIFKSGEIEHLPLMTKAEAASAILCRINKILDEKKLVDAPPN